VERTPDDDIIRLKANSTDVQTITETATHILNQLHVDGKMEFSVTNITSTSYAIGETELLIEWVGASAGTMTLPDASGNTGRHLIIENPSDFLHPCFLSSVF